MIKKKKKIAQNKLFLILTKYNFILYSVSPKRLVFDIEICTFYIKGIYYKMSTKSDKYKQQKN